MQQPVIIEAKYLSLEEEARQCKIDAQKNPLKLITKLSQFWELFLN